MVVAGERERGGEDEDEDEVIEAAMACVASASFSCSRLRLLRASPARKERKKSIPNFLPPVTYLSLPFAGW